MSLITAGVLGDAGLQGQRLASMGGVVIGHHCCCWGFRRDMMRDLVSTGACGGGLLGIRSILSCSMLNWRCGRRRISSADF